MSTTELSKQLTDLTETLRTTRTLISKLAKLSDDSRIELGQDIHETLKTLEDELDFLRQEADFYKSEGHRRRASLKDGEEARLSAKIARLGEDLNHSRQQFRNAVLTAKRASDEAKRKEREAYFESLRKQADDLAAASENKANGVSDRDLLFARRGKGQQQQKQLTKDEVLVNASSDVTASLRRTHDLLSTELSRSRFAQETFEESTQALSQLGEDYSNLDSVLSKSKDLLGTLLRSQKSDTWYLETAVYILLTTIIWLIFRRILYGPLFRLPLFVWNVFAFLTNWFILKPLFLLLSAVGVINSGPAASTSLGAASGTISSSRPPLIVQPSATGRAPSRPSDAPNGGFPVGAGGAGAKKGKDPELNGHMSEQIGKMAEQSAKQNEGPSVRGDGTVLQERDESQPNPKKKMFEADVEDAKQEGKKPNTQDAKPEQAQQRRKRDEL